MQGLRDEGHDVHVAADGDGAMALSRSGVYDVIVVAVDLPSHGGVRGGVRVGAELRSTEQTAPVLLLTSGDHDAERLVREAGAAGYLAKPFRFALLLERLGALGCRDQLVSFSPA